VEGQDEHADDCLRTRGIGAVHTDSDALIPVEYVTCAQHPKVAGSVDW
jgi:hypothetical protein